VEGTSDRYGRGRPGILRWRLDRLRDAGVFDSLGDEHGSDGSGVPTVS
jgi:hypothetical protein